MSHVSPHAEGRGSGSGVCGQRDLVVWEAVCFMTTDTILTDRKIVRRFWTVRLTCNKKSDLPRDGERLTLCLAPSKVCCSLGGHPRALIPTSRLLINAEKKVRKVDAVVAAALSVPGVNGKLPE